MKPPVALARTAFALLSLFVLPAFAPAEEALKAGVFSPARLAPDFKLSGSDGSELSLARYRGKVVVLIFGFTNCPAVCPTTLATLATAHKKLADDAAGMQVVYVTVDPERDTVQRMNEYLKAFDATFVGGTGAADKLEAIRKEYGIFANRENYDKGYSFNHSSYAYLIDKEGSLRALMPYGQAADDYVHDVRILLGTRAPKEVPPS